MITYRLIHDHACKLEGEETEYRPYLNGSVELFSTPLCIETGTELCIIERVVT